MIYTHRPRDSQSDARTKYRKNVTRHHERIRELIIHSELDAVETFGNSEVCVVTVEVPSQLVGRNVKNLTINGEITVAAITRQGDAFIPLMGTELANTWSLSVYISFALVIDVITALTLLPLMISWIKPRYVFEPG